ncbi:unnamed protein product [Echinostoma caproni]|uniref:RNase III domain-containing protein n=1 Tax=Echinostoma caproni TaxID=27848 RepID=A0A183A921_9TREM|nr:unnamed protein product [Echinostoma caproni]
MLVSSGDNQRLEFLGDSLLKYVSTDYLFRHFPRHHEGHLSLLKNSLVNKYTQAAVCSELGLDHYVIRREDNSVVKSSPSTGDSDRACPSKAGSTATTLSAQNQNVKYKADLLEAFVGALFVDKDLVWVERFCQVCFWPRLVEFILKQEWNDAKSKLQQCCLTFRSLHEEPEIAHYKVLDHSGPTNQRTYLVGVYFRGQRLATGKGRSVQQAQMEAAKRALELHQDTFRQLDFQRSVISRRYRQPYIDKMLDHVQNWDERLVDYFIHGDKPGSKTDRTGSNESHPGSGVDFVQFLKQDPRRMASDSSKRINSVRSQPHGSPARPTSSSVRGNQRFMKSPTTSAKHRTPDTESEDEREKPVHCVSENTSEEGEVQDEEADSDPDEDDVDDETTGHKEEQHHRISRPNSARSNPSQRGYRTASKHRQLDAGTSSSRRSRSEQSGSSVKRSLPSGTLADLFTTHGAR